MSQITNSVLMLSTLYIFLLLYVVKNVHTGPSIIQDAINVIQLQQTQKHSCYLSKLPPGYQVINCTDHQSPCDMMCNIESTDIAIDVCCIDGIWDVPNSGTVTLQTGHVRHKRFWVAIGIALLVGAGIACIFLCGRSTQAEYENPKPPAFDPDTCPPKIQARYETDIRSKTRRIHWDKPIAKDADGNVISDIQILAGKEAGSEFPEGHHKIIYMATDQHGYKTFCDFQFDVMVIRCKSANPPRHGYINCTMTDPIYGTICYFECDEGFELNGNSMIECLNNGGWTGDNSRSCSKIKCPKPTDPEKGEYKCPTTSNDFEYQSICWAECAVGYELEQLAYSQCAADKTWYTNREPRCIDREPPEIKCGSAYQHFYANSGNVKTNASWTLPKAEDNVDGTNVTIILDSGPSIGSDLPIGISIVQYHAEDSQRNKSPTCTKVLYVEEITCSHPSLQITDEHMKFSACRSFNLGETCTLSCGLNLPLRGDTEITCSADTGASEGNWIWSNETEPYCYEVTCPNLNAPLNGAMTCDTINLRPFCAMSCNTNYDVPYKFDGRYFCVDSGSWSPNDVVPDCTVLRRPGTMNLASELHYYSGSCDNESKLMEIKEKFMQIVSEIPTDSICIGCTIHTVNVTCGVQTKRNKRSFQRDVLEKTLHLSGRKLPDISSSDIRHKRQTNNTHETVIYFYIAVPWNQGNMTLYDAYAHHDNTTFIFRDILKDLVNTGKFNLSGYSGPDFQYESTGILQCENGILENDVCKTCSIGTQYNETTKSCNQCPLNTYQDEEGISACKQCPSGHVTVETGQKHVNECIELCPAGSFSPTTVIPCTSCPVGSYQSSIGQKTCIVCTEGTTTNSSGCTSEASCSYYNIYIDSEITNLEVSRLNSNSDNLTLGFWFQVSSKDTGSSEFSISSYHPDHGRYFSVAIQETVSVFFGQVVHTSTEYVSQGEWILLVVTLDSSSQLLTIRLKNQIALQQTFSPEVNYTSLISGSSLRMDVGSNTTIRFTGLFMASEILSNDILTSLSISCTFKTPTSFLAMSDFTGMKKADIEVEIPSSCDAVDECAANPCGIHTCINSASGFECRCLNGYSGPACEAPPDVCQTNECKNGATCINNGTKYICQCLLGYLGDFCEDAPVDGNWGDWSAWSICSASCGGGLRSKSRQCDRPAPGQYGLVCTSHDSETENCNMEQCPKCSELPLGNGTKVTVKVIDGTEIHAISCQDGLAFAPGFEPNQEYKCGISTHYQWTHASSANPLGRLPSCAEVSGPQKLATTTTILYDSLPCSALSVSRSTIEDKLTSLQCISNKTCNVSVSTTCSSNETVMATITLSASLNGKENLELTTFYNNQTIGDNLYDLVITVIELEASTQKLVNKTVYELDVEYGGHTYNSDTSSIDVVAVVTCSVGFVGANGVCVECPVGTYYKMSTSTCKYCDIGTYQDKTAQIACVQCSIGYTTVGVGSTSTRDCTVIGGADPTSNSTQSASSDVSQRKSADLAVIIGCSIASLAVIIISGAIGISVYKWRTRNPMKGSFLSIRQAVSSEADVSYEL